MISLFEKNLMRMKNELTDLKTASKRGLGTIRFYEAHADVTVVKGGPQKYITVTFDQDGFFPGFAEYIGGFFYGTMFVSADNLTFTFSIAPGTNPDPVTFTFRVVSTTPIKSMEVT